MKELETLLANVSAAVAVCAVCMTHERLEAADAAKAKLIEYVERCVKEAYESGYDKGGTWRGIETAPKDGTWIFIWRLHRDGEGESHLVKWSSVHQIWTTQDDDYG